MRGDLAPFVLYFPQPLAFFGLSPHNFLKRAKMHKSRKVTKGGTNDPILTHPVRGHWGGEPDGGGWVVVFLLGGWTLAPRRKFGIEIELKGIKRDHESVWRSEEHRNSSKDCPRPVVLPIEIEI